MFEPATAVKVNDILSMRRFHFRNLRLGGRWYSVWVEFESQPEQWRLSIGSTRWVSAGIYSSISIVITEPILAYFAEETVKVQ